MKIVSSKEILKTPRFRVTQDHASDGEFEIKRAVVQHPGAAVIVALDPKKRILLERQYRVALRRLTWEIPAGTLDPGETPLKTAKRELLEETGYRARRWTKLLRFAPSPGILNEVMTLYLAEELTAGEAKPMPDERIHAEWFTLREVEAMIAGGKIIDAKTIIGCYALRHLRGKRTKA